MALSKSLREVELRPLRHDQQVVVWQMLMHAAHERSDVRESPVLAIYGDEFGTRTGDLGIVALYESQPVGAAWVRLLKTGFAFVADDIPELAIAVLPGHQGRGIGSKLLLQLLEDLRRKRVIGCSLSCRTDNTVAMRLYEKLGFARVPGSDVKNRVGGTSVIMVKMFRTIE